MTLPEDHVEIWLTPIYHYDFVNQQGRSIRTTKYIGLLPNVNGGSIQIEGTTDLLNDYRLYSNLDCKGYYDGKKWVLCYVPKNPNKL